MINLLPTELKTGYKYARRNVHLRKWVLILLVALIGLGIIGTYGLLSLHQSTLSYNRQIDTATKTLKNQDYAGTQKRVQEISGSFKLVVQVLSQEVLFSKLLQQMATAIPPNASLTGLNINQTQGGIDIAASAIDYRTATQVQVNLADPNNKIFSKADIISITCNSKSDEQYPCKVNIRALFAPNNPFLLINNKAAKP